MICDALESCVLDHAMSVGVWRVTRIGRVPSSVSEAYDVHGINDPSVGVDWRAFERDVELALEKESLPSAVLWCAA